MSGSVVTTSKKKKPKLSNEEQAFNLLAVAASRGYLSKGFVPLKVR
jgi:hypothetical protein